MGDSITHAAAHTHGYDGIAQIFEKYIKEDLARTDDLVINTAVSGATCERTLQNIEQRMSKYKADIVSVMLGTNDSKAKYWNKRYGQQRCLCFAA
jgi:lysophospholipase L1-like esterase